jgi:hypothetical protein
MDGATVTVLMPIGKLTVASVPVAVPDPVAGGFVVCNVYAHSMSVTGQELRLVSLEGTVSVAGAPLELSALTEAIKFVLEEIVFCAPGMGNKRLAEE